MRQGTSGVLAVVAGLVLGPVLGGETGTKGAAKEIERAVAALRNIREDALTQEQKDAKGLELQKAWATLIAAGKAGTDALKAEIAKVDAAKERDDFFKLGAAAFLWQIAKLDEAPAIAGIWSGDVDLTVNYNYVFFTAYEAARTQDPRSFPLLKALLRDKKGSVYIEQHALPVGWPLSQEFLWGLVGRKGPEALMAVLGTAKDDASLETACWLLVRASHLPALDAIRRLAAEGQPGARGGAIRALGTFGHPQDYVFLVGGLASKDPKEAWHFAYALYEYEDLRAVPHLIPLLASPDEALRAEVRNALARLLVPDAFEALHKEAAKAPNEEARAWWPELTQSVLEPVGLTWDGYQAKTPVQKSEILAAARAKEEESLRLKPGDRKLTHDELLKAAAQWIQNQRITSGSYKWVEDRHVLAAATAADIPLLLDVRAACYTRLSDECLYEVRTLERIINRLGRSRYRKEPGLCEKAEPVK
jgi:HEAT repeat protein